MEKTDHLSNTKMSPLLKLKNRTNVVSASYASYAVFQEIGFPIFSFDLSEDIDCDLIKDKCLELQHGESQKKELVKNGWQSPFYSKKSKEAEPFLNLVTTIENKMASIAPNSPLEVRQIWTVVYNQENYYNQEWHIHVHLDTEKDPATLYKYSAVFYPMSSSTPIEFRQERKENIIIEATAGKLLLFPSVLWHRVPLSKDSNLRVSMAFNLYPVGL